jgi:3-hydroxyacyl-CoA dehydrogenase
MLKKPAAERLKLLRESSNPQAQFLWAILRDAFHYAAVHLGRLPTTPATSTSRCAGALA